ncbi:disease resistance protein RPP8-like [Macadamia integrifolia]|uniref:disease resistance protein RPP8-like n=1 Tax=Macadamia integrifolia TaxID=60698 RepID=UPI001C4ED694|nr:disease resistance protein RPP8-like [Macadamia integrifolia]
MLHLPSLLRHRHLNEMIVEGTITEANDFPPHLTYLWLENSVANGVDPFIPLQKLRFLKKLCLRLFKAQSDAQIQITCSMGGFPKLEYLYIRVDFELRNWIVEEGALASLQVLHIDGDATLGELPHGLRYIKTLKELVITRGYDVRDNLMYGRNEWVADLGLSIKYLDESSMRP